MMTWGNSHQQVFISFPAFQPFHYSRRGDNRYGQLGRPAGAEDPSPGEVQGLQGLKVLLLVAGSQQGLALCHHEDGQEDVVALQEKDDSALLAIPVDKTSLVDPDAIGNRRR